MCMALSCAYPCTLAMSTDGRAPWCKDVPVGISNVCSGVCGVLSSFDRHFVAVSDLSARLLERVLGGSGATFWSCQGSWEACWGHLGSQIDFHRFLVATGTREPSHLGPKLEPCCGQVGTCWGLFGASAALLRIFKYGFNLEDSRH